MPWTSADLKKACFLRVEACGSWSHVKALAGVVGGGTYDVPTLLWIVLTN